jgi:AcrR family transcriptional regulator
MSEIRRAEISQALYRCIVKRGYSGTTVRDIAKEAGVRSGLIHHYFTSKDEILEVLSHDIIDKWQERAAHLLEKDEDRHPSERLRVGIDFIFLEIAGDRDLVKVFHELWNLAEHDEALNKALRSLYRQYRNSVASIIEQFLCENEVPGAAAKDLAAFLVSASEGASIQWFIDPRGISLSRLSALACRLVETIAEPRN